MRQRIETAIERRQVEDDFGFTLIELLVVIVILGILAGIAVFAVQSLTGTSVASACATDLKTVEVAVESYRAQMGNYPDGTGGLGSIGTPTDGDSASSGVVNAAGAISGAAVDQGGLGSELLTGSMSETNNGFDTAGNVTRNVPMSPSVGPWLKDLPQNGGRYYIWVSNDGKGTVLVGTGSDYSVPPNPANVTCAAAGVGS